MTIFSGDCTFLDALLKDHRVIKSIKPKVCSEWGCIGLNMKPVLLKRVAKLSSVVVGFAAVSSANTQRGDADHVSNSFGGYSIPVDKLVCHRNIHSALTGVQGGQTQPVVLVACGSFNPPTCAHMRVLEVVREEYLKRGVNVYGAYLSPVHNAYGKQGLVYGNHRLVMCNAAAESSGKMLLFQSPIFVSKHIR